MAKPQMDVVSDQFLVDTASVIKAARGQSAVIAFDSETAGKLVWEIMLRRIDDKPVSMFAVRGEPAARQGFSPCPSAVFNEDAPI